MLSSNLLKIKKLWGEQGGNIVIKRIAYLVAKKNRLIRGKSNLIDSNAFLKILDEEKALSEISRRIFNSGLCKPLGEIKSAIKRMSSESAYKVLEEANELLDNEYTIYGTVKIRSSKDQFSWLRDPLTNYMWPLNLASSQIIWNKPYGTDIKNTWEPARFQFISVLAQAYILTGEERYACFATDKITSWIDENPFPLGPHWTVAMEAAIRLMNWCFYFPLLDIDKLKSSTTTNKLIKSVVEHFYYIWKNLEIAPGYANNHYLTNLAALLLCRILFPSAQWAIECSEFGEKELSREIERQFTDSGMNFEGSLPYHRLSSEICLVAAALIKQNGRALPEEIKQRVHKIAEFTEYYSSICDNCPLIGDNDSGIFVKFFNGQELNRHRYLNFLFDCILSEKRTPSSDEEYLCSIHFSNIERRSESYTDDKKSDETIKCQVKNFNGLIIARHEGEGLFFNTLNSSEGHTHNDKLSVYPVISKKLLFIDRGSFSYTGFTDKRHEDRRSSSHNGPVVNGWEQSRIWENDLFYINGDAICENYFECNDCEVKMTGWHTGYGRYVNYLKVVREVKWNITHRTIVITDWMESTKKFKKYQLSWYFLINPDWEGKIDNNSLILISQEQKVQFLCMEGINVSLSRGLYCPSYQTEAPCQALKVSRIASSDEKTNFILRY